MSLRSVTIKRFSKVSKDESINIGGNVVPHLQGISVTVSLLWTLPGLLCYAVNQITEPVREKAPSVSDGQFLVALTSLTVKSKHRTCMTSFN